MNLTGRLSKCGVVSPRFDVHLKYPGKWPNNLLPSRQFGFIVLTTSAGLMDREEARQKHKGGKILGFLTTGLPGEALILIFIPDSSSTFGLWMWPECFSPILYVK